VNEKLDTKEDNEDELMEIDEDELLDAVMDMEESNPPSKIANCLLGLTFVISGVFEQISRDKL
jgi:BRCT domain type II-containing protein